MAGNRKRSKFVSPKVDPLVPKGLQIMVHNDLEKRQLYFNIVYVDGSRIMPVGSADDLWTRKDEDVSVPGLPPYSLEYWMGFVFDTQENAMVGREAIRLFLLARKGWQLENV